MHIKRKLFYTKCSSGFQSSRKSISSKLKDSILLPEWAPGKEQIILFYIVAIYRPRSICGVRNSFVKRRISPGICLKTKLTNTLQGQEMKYLYSKMFLAGPCSRSNNLLNMNRTSLIIITIYIGQCKLNYHCRLSLCLTWINEQM